MHYIAHKYSYNTRKVQRTYSADTKTATQSILLFRTQTYASYDSFSIIRNLLKLVIYQTIFYDEQKNIVDK